MSVTTVFLLLAGGRAMARGLLDHLQPGDPGTITMNCFLANLNALTTAVAAQESEVPIPETIFKDEWVVEPAQGDPGVQGAKLAQEQLQLLAAEIEQDVPAVSAEQAEEVILEGFSQIQGKSEGDTPRMATIWDPFRVGRRFRIRPASDQGLDTAATPIALLRNVTVMQQSLRYNELNSSALTDYFILEGDESRVCFANSEFILGLCEDFPGEGEEPIYAWCCSNEACPITFSLDQAQFFSPPLATEGENVPITCRDVWSKEDWEERYGGDGVSVPVWGFVLIVLGAVGAGAGLLFVIIVAVRRFRARRRDPAAHGDVGSQKSSYYEQGAARGSGASLDGKYLAGPGTTTTTTSSTMIGAAGESSRRASLLANPLAVRGPYDTTGSSAAGSMKSAGTSLRPYSDVLAAGAGMPAPMAGPTWTRTIGSAPSTEAAASMATGNYEIMQDQPPRPLPENELDALEDALDWLTDRREPFFGQYEVLSAAHRRRGGQGVVQFVKRARDGVEFAVKFFLYSAAFEAELHLYANPRLKSVLPSVSAVEPNEDGAVECRGFRFPPFIIVEKGESLMEWAYRVAPDLPTTLQVLIHVVKRLRDLHAAGLSHRDLKPGNILWRPSANAWTLIDFGCAALNGEEATLIFSMHYAAPEVLAALEAGEGTIIAQASADIWSVGIVAVELLTGRRVFPPGATRQQVIAQVMGTAPMPWEHPETAPAYLRQLKILRRSVLACLNRDPAARPTADDLLGAWLSVFDATTVAPGGGGPGVDSGPPPGPMQEPSTTDTLGGTFAEFDRGARDV